MATERSLILFKPDCIQRRLCGQLLCRIDVEKPFYPLLEEFITAAPVIALVVEGPDAIGVMRNLLGTTNGRDAALGTIRGDYGVSRQMNLVHGCDGPEAAAREIDIYFRPEELYDYTPTLGEWVCADDEK